MASGTVGNTLPLEVSLVSSVKQCRTCAWFWGGTPPYGPYPSYDWNTDFPEQANRTEAQSPTGSEPRPWLQARLTGARFIDPGIMHGCRKAPIMTVGINPNLTAWFPYTSAARWLYPGFDSDARYAYYYRHFTLYQESVSLDLLRENLNAAERIVAEDDGWVVGATRENSHNYILLTVQYRGRAEPTSYEIAWTPDARWVIVQDDGKSDDDKTWFKKGAPLAGRFDAPNGLDAQIYENPSGYYQRMVEVLNRFKRKAGLQSANLTVGEDVAQHDMVACASPGWQGKFDMAMERIAYNCVSDHGWMVSQFVQSQPAVVILVGGSALSMFRRVFGPFMTLADSERDIYQLLDETCTRPTYVTIDIGDVKFRSRVLTPPHFSYGANFFAQARLSDPAWLAFQKDFADDVKVLQANNRIWEPSATGVVPIELRGKTDPIRAKISVAGWQVLNAYYMDPNDMLAQALADEFKTGTLAFDQASGHLKRADGPCRFCVNNQWTFPEGCAYGKPDLPPQQPGQLESVVQTILKRAREAAAARRAPAPAKERAVMTISNHIAVPEPVRDLEWLKSALQTAIALEHATMPLYLAATYSMKVLNYTAYNLLRSIAMEEMVHMAIACNILAAIGGRPQIRTLNPAYPSQGLPGNAEPDLYVCLAQLSKRQLKNFMRLEIPAFLLPDEYNTESYPTISKLYKGIRGALAQNAGQIRAAVKKGGTSNQVGDDIGFTTIVYSEQQDPLQQMEDGIDEILMQGEGCTALHAGAAAQGEESHYSKFAEIFYGHQFQDPGNSAVQLSRDTEPQFFKGYPIEFPEVQNILMVPSDGYAKILAIDSRGADVKKDLDAFDQAYSGLMENLDAMWNGPAAKSWPTFGAAVETMGKLRILGCFNIMKYQVPPDAVAKLATLYPDEFDKIKDYTRLNEPVFYGPRFRNVNSAT